MDDNIINLGIGQMACAYIFILVVIFLARLKGIKREKQILIATIRMTIQLTIVGYLLIYIFKSQNPIFTIAIILVMEAFAIRNIVKLAKFKVSNEMLRIIIVSLMAGSIICVSYFLFVVIRIQPTFNPQYVIPITGMLLGNSMTGISIGLNRMQDDMKSNYDKIEAALMLGANARMASSEVIKNAFDAAILPTINSMMSIGVVSLPGMMTGQILSGTSPIIAIQYQIAIMLGILGSVALCVFIFTAYGYKTYFNKDLQLIIDSSKES